MKNPFKTIGSDYEVPKKLKGRILDDVMMIKCTYDIADLFLIKYPNTLTDYYIKEKVKYN